MTLLSQLYTGQCEHGSYSGGLAPCSPKCQRVQVGTVWLYKIFLLCLSSKGRILPTLPHLNSSDCFLFLLRHHEVYSCWLMFSSPSDESLETQRLLNGFPVCRHCNKQLCSFNVGSASDTCAQTINLCRKITAKCFAGFFLLLF